MVETFIALSQAGFPNLSADRPFGVDLPIHADAGFLPFSKSNLLPKQSTRLPLPRSQVGASLMTFPLVKL